MPSRNPGQLAPLECHAIVPADSLPWSLRHRLRRQVCPLPVHGDRSLRAIPIHRYLRCGTLRPPSPRGAHRLSGARVNRCTLCVRECACPCCAVKALRNKPFVISLMDVLFTCPRHKRRCPLDCSARYMARARELEEQTKREAIYAERVISSQCKLRTLLKNKYPNR